MHTEHPKRIRRKVLQFLYRRYQADPLDMLTPEDMEEDGGIAREDLCANVYYLADRGLVELMRGYNPPMFAAARITADGIDLVEDMYEFGLRFPPAPDEEEQASAAVPRLMEALVAQADFAALDGEARRCLLRDVQYLREEIARPAHRWRREVVRVVLGWIRGYFAEPESALPVLTELEREIDRCWEA